jgi:hypothetical protein
VTAEWLSTGRNESLYTRSRSGLDNNTWLSRPLGRIVDTVDWILLILEADDLSQFGKAGDLGIASSLTE